MHTSPLSPSARRIPPGLWTALAWFAAAVYPIIEYVVLPRQYAYSLSYPRDGLDPLAARLLLALAFALVLAGCVAARRRPVPGWALVLLGTVLTTVAWRQDEIPPPQLLGVDVALCQLAAVRPRRAAVGAVAVTLGVLAAYPALRWLADTESGTASEPFMALTVVTAWLVGDSLRQTRAHTAELHARTVAQAATAERLRIAREMHDTVAHSIGIIALQAGAAARVIETQPERAREALSTVERVGRETLAGLRRTLGALREADREREAGREGGRPWQGDSPRPGAGLADLERLAASTTAAGVPVRVEWRGRRRPLPADVDLAAFRIVQEAVTNVVRHAGGAPCRVRVDHGDDVLAIEVADRGSGARPGRADPSGFGLLGMRERAALLGGHMTAGPRPGGGFLVTARLPVPAADGATERREGAG
ncbi:sensor histidine kinase [Streptomyces marincola]|uniref:sensor histidine kinase n=1 Tax=Streptomyces marincola TaxID=2878388 RepID=UPI001CF404F7|nr:sensor histidine kinase [Streptomyces marincola]UCM87949.1 sensor histidine kinase [Streptomyces marincola]